MKMGNLLKNISKHIDADVTEDALSNFLKKAGKDFGRWSDDGTEFILNKGVKSKTVANAFGESNSFRKMLETIDTTPAKKLGTWERNSGSKVLTTYNPSGDLESKILKQRKNFDKNMKETGELIGEARENRAQYQNLLNSDSKHSTREKILNSRKNEQNYYNSRSGSGNKAYKRTQAYKDELEKNLYNALEKGDLDNVDLYKNELNSWEKNSQKRKEKIKMNRERDSWNNLDSETKQMLNEYNSIGGGGKTNQQGNPNPAGNAAIGNKSAKKKKDPKADNWVHRAAAIGVGGGLVLSMSNNKGQQTNQQLYGQGGY